MISYRTVYLSLFVSMLAASAAAAQQPEGYDRGFGVSPSRLSVVARPGGQASATFTLSALGTQGMGKYTIEVLDLGQSTSGSVSPVPRGQGARSCADWIDVSEVVQVSAGTSRNVEITIRCPSGATGNYYAILNVATAPTRPQEKGMAITVRPTIGVSLEVTIPQPAPSHLEPTRLVYQAGSGGTSPSLLLQVENTGVWKKPVEGDILVHTSAGQFPVRAQIPFENSGNPYEVYPGMILTLNCPLSKSLQPGTHHVSVRLRLTEKAQARKEFDLVVPGGISGSTTVEARAGRKSELDVALSVEPDFIEVAIPPGGRRTLPIRVRNDDAREVRVSAQVTQAHMERSGMVTYSDASGEATTGLLSLSSETFQLAPRRSTTVLLTAAIPKTGSISLPFIGVVRLQADAPATKYHDDWASGGEYPVIIVIQEPKASPASLRIEKFTAVRPGAGQNPSAAVLRVKNAGEKIARVYGLILLERSGGQEIVRMDIGYAQPELILPGSEREFRMPIGPLDRGGFRLKSEVSLVGSRGSTQRAEVTFEAQ